MICTPVNKSAFPAKGSLNMHRNTEVPSHLYKVALLSGLSEDIGIVVEFDPNSEMFIGGEGYPYLNNADVGSNSTTMPMSSDKPERRAPLSR